MISTVEHYKPESEPEEYRQRECIWDTTDEFVQRNATKKPKTVANYKIALCPQTLHKMLTIIIRYYLFSNRKYIRCMIDSIFDFIFLTLHPIFSPRIEFRIDYTLM